MNIEEIISEIMSGTTEDTVIELVDDRMSEYVHPDWDCDYTYELMEAPKGLIGRK